MRRLKIDAKVEWHVFARGTRRLLLFYEDKDFLTFLSMLREALEKSGCLLLGYCLMSNHYHLVLRATSQELTRCMWRLNRSYALYHNRQHHLGGHVFDGPYKAYRQKSLFLLVRRLAYVFLNPVAAGKATRAEDYRWSSYLDYLGVGGRRLHADSSFLFGRLADVVKDPKGWFQWLVGEQAKLIPSKLPDYRSAAQVNAEQFEWLLRHAREQKATPGDLEADLVAMYWGAETGIPPRSMAKVLGDKDAGWIRKTLYAFRKRLKQDPALMLLLTPP